MTKAEIFAQNQQAIIEKYDSYKSGHITRDEWILYLCDLLENYFKQRITLKHRTMGAEFDDLMQQSREAICKMVDNYDPRRSMPTSFFTSYIDQYQKDAINNESMSKYYIGTYSKLDRVAKQNGFSGVDDPTLSSRTLSILADTSLKTVRDTKKFKSMSTVSLQAVSDNVGFDDAYVSPEKAYLEKEASAILADHFRKLSPLEQFLIVKVVIGEPTSYRTLVRMLKTKEYQERFGDELPEKVEQVFLEKTVNTAIKRLQENPNILKYIPEKNVPAPYKEVTVHEQASEEDIANAINSNILILQQSKI